MEWLVIDEDYLSYLRSVENRIPFSNYGNDKYKPFFGVLFETDTFYYVTQISHAQPRHAVMKNNIDFKKIYHPKDNRLLAVVNLNYMFPILKSQKKVLKYQDIELHRSFSDDSEKSKYIDLLKMEIRVLSSMSGPEKTAKMIYSNKYTEKNKPLADRSFDFKQLERLALQYGQEQEN